LALLAMSVGAALLLYVLVGLLAQPREWAGALAPLVFVGLINASIWAPFWFELRRAKRDWAFLVDLVVTWSNGRDPAEGAA
jgi:hypothetical protein